MTLEEHFAQLGSDYIRLGELYANQQLIIEKLILNGCRTCQGTTTVTYVLPIADVNEATGNNLSPQYVKKLRTAREALGWTQEELADRIGVAHTTFRNWELGNRVPHIPTIERWASALGMYATIIIQPLERSKLLSDVTLEEV